MKMKMHYTKINKSSQYDDNQLTDANKTQIYDSIFVAIVTRYRFLNYRIFRRFINTIVNCVIGFLESDIKLLEEGLICREIVSYHNLVNPPSIIEEEIYGGFNESDQYYEDEEYDKDEELEKELEEFEESLEEEINEEELVIPQLKTTRIVLGGKQHVV